MDPVQLLMDEHRTIERVLSALEKVAQKRETKATLKEFVLFLREYADRLHHGKEEDILFAEMVNHGFPKEGGPIAVMLMEHDQGRAHIQVMSELAEHEKTWTPRDHETLFEHGMGYVNLLRTHIQKEDQILYPLARQHLPEAVWSNIVKGCVRFEEDPEHRAAKERYQKFAITIGS